MDSPGFILYFIMKAIFKKKEERGVTGREERRERRGGRENRKSNTESQVSLRPVTVSFLFSAPRQIHS